MAIEFSTWRAKAQDTVEFIPITFYEDLLWIVWGLNGVAKTYLNMDGTHILAHEGSGSDVVEHHFDAAVMANSNASAFKMHAFSAKSTGVRSATFCHCTKTKIQGDEKLIGAE
eukprot:1133851-Ditylum_brightwellii.AAC.1